MPSECTRKEVRLETEKVHCKMSAVGLQQLETDAAKAEQVHNTVGNVNDCVELRQQALAEEAWYVLVNS